MQMFCSCAVSFCSLLEEGGGPGGERRFGGGPGGERPLGAL